MTALSFRPRLLRSGRPLPSPSRLGQAQGLTLIELILTMTIAGILAAIMVPQLAGIYSNQLVVNTANELVTDIKLAQNRALANDQTPAGHAATNPQGDCTSLVRYVDQWGLKFTSASQYQVYVNYRTTSKGGQTCLGNADGDVQRLTRSIPDTVQIQVSGGSPTNYYIEYATTSGKPSSGGLFGGGSGYVVSSTRTNLRYYVCVDAARRAYAQTTACP